MAQDDVIPRVASLFSKVYDGPNNDKFRHPIRKKCQSSEDEYLYESDNDRNGQSVEALVGEECAETSQKELLLLKPVFHRPYIFHNLLGCPYLVRGQQIRS